MLPSDDVRVRLGDGAEGGAQRTEVAFGPNADGVQQGWNLTTTQIVDGHATGVTGILYGGSGGGQLIAQLVGVVTIVVVMGALSWGFFALSKVIFGGIRSDEDDEIAGLDLPEMGVPAYPDFAGTGETESAGDLASAATSTS